MPSTCITAKKVNHPMEQVGTDMELLSQTSLQTQEKIKAISGNIKLINTYTH